MARKKGIKFVYPTKENLIILEEMNLSYDEMKQYFTCRITNAILAKYFCLFKIKHKNKQERIRDRVIEDTLNGKSQAQLAIKYNVSKRTIARIRKEYYDKNKTT